MISPTVPFFTNPGLLLFPFELKNCLCTIHTLTLLLLLINQTRNVDTFWLGCHTLFILLLSHSCEQGLTELILTKEPSSIIRRQFTHYLHLISTSYEVNLSVSTDTDEAFVLWPNPKIWRVVENLPFLWLTSHYLYPSEERSHHTRWPLILRFTQPPRTPFGIRINGLSEPYTKSLSIFSKNTLLFSKVGECIYLFQKPIFFQNCSLKRIRTYCKAFTIFINLTVCEQYNGLLCPL